MVHITLGDRFLDDRSPVFYRVGFGLRGGEESELADFSVEVHEGLGGHRRFSVDCRHYTSPHPLTYSRTFCFAEIDKLSDPSSFFYSIFKGKTVVKGPFSFSSDLMTSMNPKIVTFGDHDLSVPGLSLITALKNAKVTGKYLRTEEKPSYDLIVHLGDIAYDIQDQNGEKGDLYFEAMEEIFTQTPVIITAGNHDMYDRGRMMNARLSMPGCRSIDDNNLTGFRVQNTFWLALNLDFVIRLQPDERIQILKKIEKMLEESKHRGDSHRVFLSHRPLFCGDFEFFRPTSCLSFTVKLQDVIQLLQKYDVRFLIAGHIHYYQRLKGASLFESEAQRNSGASFVVGTAGNGYFFGKTERTFNPNVVKTLDESVAYMEVTVGESLQFRLKGLEGEELDFVEFLARSSSVGIFVLRVIGFIWLFSLVYLWLVVKNWNESKLYAGVELEIGRRFPIAV